MFDSVQKARIQIEKKGMMFVGVDRKDTDPVLTVPVFAEKLLAGVTFTVTAKDDIVAPDGTMRARAGDVVATVTTDETGVAITDPLYLGIYEIREVETPAGYVLDSNVEEVKLFYADQTVEIHTTTLSKVNACQKIAICFTKTMEKDDRYTIRDAYTKVRFGLYAAEDITGADGAVLPVNSLVAVTEIDENGNGQFNIGIPFGKYFIREIETDERYAVDETKYEFIFSPASSEQATVKVTLNDGKVIVNKLRRGSLRITKTFEGQETPVEGVAFRITNEELGFDQVHYTDKNGEILIEGLVVGTYKVTEMSCTANVGYVLSATAEAVVEKNKTTEIAVDNRKSPKTGDTTAFPAKVGFVVASVAACGMLVSRKKKKA